MNIPPKNGQFLLTLNGTAPATVYPDPTGEGTPLALTYRGSATAADSPFAVAGRSVVLYNIAVLRGSASTSTLSLQKHDGTLIELLGVGVGGGAADQLIDFGEKGVNIPGGFRLVVGVASIQALIVYGVEKTVAP